jgi:serine/threonine protein kinase
MTLSQGDHLGRFEILDRIGAGGMGEVWRAKDSSLGREVAIKVLPAEVADSPERRKRFEREARATAGLNHPNILTIFEVSIEDVPRCPVRGWDHPLPGRNKDATRR